MSLAQKRFQMVFLALLLSIFCLLLMMQQDKLPLIAFADDGSGALVAKDKRVVVQFERSEITVQENESFEIGVLASNWNEKTAKDVKVELSVSDPELDIVNTKFPSARKTLLDMRKQGTIVYGAVNGSRYLTASKEFTEERAFYIKGRAEETMLCIAGHYTPENTGDRTVVLTLREPGDHSPYTVGKNDTLTITFKEVDADRPAWNGESKGDWVRANLAWLRAKFPAGTYWNHYIGNSNDPDGITAVPCQGGKHKGVAEITERMDIGTTICNNSSLNMYVLYNNQRYLYIDQKQYSFIQCVGYAMTLARDIFGSIPYDGEGWKEMESAREWKRLEPGDYVRIDGHSFLVIDAHDNTVTVTENNVDEDPCIIFWDVLYRVSEDGTTVARCSEQGMAPPQKIEAVTRMMR